MEDESDEQDVFEEAIGDKEMDGECSFESPNRTNDSKSVEAAATERSAELDEYAKERFETAVFTLATFAAVFAVYICIVYSLSSSPTVMHRV